MLSQGAIKQDSFLPGVLLQCFLIVGNNIDGLMVRVIWCERNFQQYFIYVVAVCFIGRGYTYLLVSDFNMENIKYIRVVGILSRR